MSLIYKQDKELVIEALDFYASELILERVFIPSEADPKLGYVSAGYDSAQNMIILNEVNSLPAHETGEPQETHGSGARTVLSNKIRSVQTLRNWIMLDLAKSKP
jgi:hypothetical protein